MGISVFPAGGGEFVTNDFVIDMNDTTNNVADLGRSYAAGSYGVTTSSGDSSFDIYVLDADGNSVGYTNESSLVATAQFTQIVILGVSSSEVISFDFNGAVTNASSEGDATGAGAYLESISPSDLPNVDDTANVIGGNFATDVEIYFESGTVSTEAKNVVRSDSTALVVTRPDTLDPDLDPWDVKAINPGVTPPTGTNDHILSGTVDAGASPVWTTTSPLPAGTAGVAYSATVVATDADGQTVDYAITSGSLVSGLSLNGTTGVISGTPAGLQSTFEITASDTAGNGNPRSFDIPITVATGGSVSTVGNYTIHEFTSSGDFVALGDIPDAEYIILAGGGSGADRGASGGGGGGGLLSSFTGFQSGSATSALSPVTINAGTLTVTIGAGGAQQNDSFAVGNPGSDSSIATIGTAIGGGGGGSTGAGVSGGSGGGSRAGNSSPGAGTSGQGFSGGVGANNNNGGGGGGGGSAQQGQSPNTVQESVNISPGDNGGDGGKGTHNLLDERGWGAGGGAASNTNGNGGSGGGSTGNNQSSYAGNGAGTGTNANSATDGFGGGGGAANGSGSGAGGSGRVVIGYEG